MSVTTTLAALKPRLETVNPAPQPSPRIVYARPAEAVNLDDFPAIVLALAPGQQHTWRLQAYGLGGHDYTVAIYVFLGGRNLTDLPELHERAEPWPQAIADVLLADLTLANQVEVIGAGDSDRLFDYTIGPIQWADGIYWGLKLLLPVKELHNQTTG